MKRPTSINEEIPIIAEFRDRVVAVEGVPKPKLGLNGGIELIGEFRDVVQMEPGNQFNEDK